MQEKRGSTHKHTQADSWSWGKNCSTFFRLVMKWTHKKPTRRVFWKYLKILSMLCWLSVWKIICLQHVLSARLEKSFSAYTQRGWKLMMVNIKKFSSTLLLGDEVIFWILNSIRLVWRSLCRQIGYLIARVSKWCNFREIIIIFGTQTHSTCTLAALSAAHFAPFVKI